MDFLVDPDKYSEATLFEVEGARVAVVVCETCGAAILLDPRDPANRTEQHTAWHSALAGPRLVGTPEGEDR